MWGKNNIKFFGLCRFISKDTNIRALNYGKIVSEAQNEPGVQSGVLVARPVNWESPAPIRTRILSTGKILADEQATKLPTWAISMFNATDLAFPSQGH